MLLTAIAGIIILIILVIVHEFGHALAARLYNVGVAEFGIGFGKPRIKLGTVKKIPIYLCLWLFGGYVRIKQKEDLESYNAKGEYFDEILLWPKICILFAGIIMNLILAIILRIILFIAFPEGGLKFNFFYKTIILSAAPVWYLIPFAAFKSVILSFW